MRIFGHQDPALPAHGAPAAMASVRPDCHIVVDTQGNHSPSAATDCKDLATELSSNPTVPATTTTSSSSARPRIYYVDWLRVFLTVLVLVHHCVCTYTAKSSFWIAKGDTALFLLSKLFVVGNQAYFMSLFFFLSGLYVPASYQRKGPASFLWDRTLRLVTPCLFYSFLVPPFIIWWNQMAANPNGGASLGAAFARWLKPGWPSQYNIATGPPWFIWMLWCFNVAYVILVELVGLVQRRCCRRARVASSASLTDVVAVATAEEQQQQQAHKGLRGRTNAGAVEMSSEPAGSSATSLRQLPRTLKVQKPEYTPRQMIITGTILTVALFVLCYSVRVLDMFVWKLPPAGFVQRGPFVSFMPDFFVVYVVCFTLGTFSHPKRWDVLRRLPSGWAGWLLGCGGVWWTLAGFVPGVALHSGMAMQKGSLAFLMSWLLITFVEQSFAVVWSAGLLILFRDAFNARPNWVGKQIIGGAYGAYIVHPVIIVLFARALMKFVMPSVVVNAAAMSAPVVFFSWLIACGLRAIPYFDRVL